MSLNISDFFCLFVCKIATPPPPPGKTLSTSFPATLLPLKKSSQASSFRKFGRRFNPPSQQKGGCTLWLSPTQIWRIQWWCLLFPFLKGSILFIANLFQKIKTVCWSQNLEPRLIRTCRIQWWFSFYSFLDWKYLFRVNLVQKFEIASLSLNLAPKLFRISKIRWWFFFFLF